MKDNWLASIVISVFILIGYLYPEMSMLKHLVIGLIILLASATKSLKIHHVRFILGLLGIFFFGLLNAGTNLTVDSLKLLLLFISPLIASFIFVRSLGSMIPSFIRVLFWTAFVFQVLVIIKSENGILNLGMFQLISGTTDTSNLLLSTSSSIESSFGFLFGYLALYFLNEKKYSYFYICLVLFLINYKRIVLVGFILAGIYLLYCRFKNSEKVHFRSIISIGPAIALIALLAVSSGSLNDIIRDTTGKSVNHLTTGRYNIHHALYEKLFEIPDVLIGHGLGETVRMVQTFDFTRMVWAHSDYLMLFYDFGLIGFIIFFALFMSKFLVSSHQAVYIIFFLVLLIFDNTMIYFDVMFLFYVLLLNEDKKPDMVFLRK